VTLQFVTETGDIGVGDTPREIVRNALRALGEPYATEVAERAELEEDGP
jgi:hypothetical protein